MTIFGRTFEEDERDWFHKVNAEYRLREDRKLRRRRMFRKIRTTIRRWRGML